MNIISPVRYKTIAVQEYVYYKLIEVRAELELRMRRRLSLSDVIDYLIERYKRSQHP